MNARTREVTGCALRVTGNNAARRFIPTNVRVCSSQYHRGMAPVGLRWPPTNSAARILTDNAMMTRESHTTIPSLLTCHPTMLYVPLPVTSLLTLIIAPLIRTLNCC